MAGKARRNITCKSVTNEVTDYRPRRAPIAGPALRGFLIGNVEKKPSEIRSYQEHTWDIPAARYAPIVR
jgi:hypothetical protein